MKIVHAPYWGWPDENGSYDGVVGQIQLGEVDIGGGGIFMQKGRLDAVDFATTTNIYKYGFSPGLNPGSPADHEAMGCGQKTLG